MKWRIYHYGGSHVKLAFSALLMRNLEAEHAAANVAALPSQASSSLLRLLDAFANTGVYCISLDRYDVYPYPLPSNADEHGQHQSTCLVWVLCWKKWLWAGSKS